MSTKSKSKKEKSKISKLIEKSDSENDENEHELSFYIDDRVKLMKEVLKIIKPKKIKAMAPDCIKDLDIEEINSMLLEELLGISNKRLKYIFNGQNLGEDSSSTDPEEEKQPIDIISLDDVSDDDFIIDVDSDKPQKKKHMKIKEESKVKKVKREKHDKSNKTNKQKEQFQEENLMSVLELLELQARARAIRSQLMLEASKKSQQETEVKIDEDSDDEDAIIIEIPKNDQIVITSSDSENEQMSKDTAEMGGHVSSSEQKDEVPAKKKKIKLVRDRFEKSKTNDETPTNESDAVVSNELTDVHIEKNKENSECTNINNADVDGDQSDKEKQSDSTNEGNKEVQSKAEHKQDNHCNDDDDEIILIVDQEEMEGIIGDTEV